MILNTGTRENTPYAKLVGLMYPEGQVGRGGDHDTTWTTKMNNRATQHVPEGSALCGVLMDLTLVKEGE